MQIVRGVEGPLGNVTATLVTNGGNGRRDVFHVPFDPTSDDVVEVVVRAVAVIQNVEPTELPPLENAVDPDALSAIFGSDSEASTTDVQVTFVYEGLEITVNSDGNVYLEWV